MADGMVISVRGVSKDFRFSSSRANTLKSIFTSVMHRKDVEEKTQHALEDISFEVKKGEFFGIVGRNGSGKSTLLKLMAGIYQPNKGKVLVAGRLVPFIELGVGFNPELTGRENVYMNGALLGFGTKEIDGFYGEVVEFAELEKFMDQKLKNYSSGMQVRLAFSMAIRADADILLIDEVLAVGDADFQRKCFDYFKQLKKNRKTVVFVSHDMDAVREYCDRAILVEKSKVIARGSANDIASKYKKMFIEDHLAESEKRKVESVRWGTGEAVFTDISIKPAIIKPTVKHLEINCTLKAVSDIENPIVGFFIKDSSGKSLLGTNSKIKTTKIKNITKGDSVNLSWLVPNIFADGHHTVGVAATNSSGSVNLDWWEEAASFRCLSTESVPYPVNPPIELKVIDKFHESHR